ncbi:MULTISPECIES: hypothetical protein [unclassified Streptomyces]|uniref:hypothetical protein n=1 Tax=unclassified Streptomyces TaxID=2593676 RepID=UPI003668ED46
MVTFDAPHHTFTATASETLVYDEKTLLPGGGPIKVSRCFTFTSSKAANSMWTTTMEERNTQMCDPGQAISDLVTLAELRVKNMDPSRLNRVDMAEALDPTRQQAAYDVKDTVRQGVTATVVVLIRAPRSMSASAAQCYRLIRHLDTTDEERAVTSTPISTC